MSAWTAWWIAMGVFTAPVVLFVVDVWGPPKSLKPPPKD
jgi:hypothetical protein